MESNLMSLLAKKQEVNEEVALVTIVSFGVKNCNAGAMMVVDNKDGIKGERLGG